MSIVIPEDIGMEQYDRWLAERGVASIRQWVSGNIGGWSGNLQNSGGELLKIGGGWYMEW